MVIRGTVTGINIVPGGLHVVKFQIALVGGQTGESVSRNELFLTLKAESNIYEMEKSYDFPVPVTPYVEPVPEPPAGN